MPIDKHALRDWKSRLRDILNLDWDPIGGCPSDEYDTYRDELTSMVSQGMSDDELLAYLKRVEADYMGLRSFDVARGRKVIAALRQLGPIR